jgi:uncharacterized membrane protein YkvA (DUF1232 family)
MESGEPKDPNASYFDPDEMERDKSEPVEDDDDETIGTALQMRVSEDRANRFYDRIRASIERGIGRNEKMQKYKEFLLFVPDVFVLLFRLTTDGRVSSKNKMLLGSGIAYYIFPLDVVPEMIVGPIGFLDDLVFGAYILNRVLADTDEEVLRQHWSGRGDVLDMVRKVLDTADRLVATDFLKKIKKWTE